MASRGGQPGNQNAVKTPWKAALERAIAQEDGKRLRAAAERLLDLAAEGEAWAVNHIADRLDGRPAQALDIQGDLELTVNVVSFGTGGGNNPSS